MQLFAFNKKNESVSANHAFRQQDYICTECGGVVRLRGGAHRQKHFYHLKPDWACRQSQKSLVHLQVQRYLQEILPEDECVLERRFPEIRRIADVVWESEKLIFEVQCSGITAEEVASRNADYFRLGYQVIWILHEKRFNKWRLTASEFFLRESPHYFTNMDAGGRGFIYDQVDVIHKGRRKPIKKYFRTHLGSPIVIPESDRLPPKGIPEFLEKRLKYWPLFFSGDFVDCWRGGDAIALMSMEETWNIEQSLGLKSKRSLFSKVRDFLYRVFVRPYLLFFRILLEKACK